MEKSGLAIRPTFYTALHSIEYFGKGNPNGIEFFRLFCCFCAESILHIAKQRTKFLHFQWPFYHFQLNFYYKHAWLSKRSSCIIQHLIRILMKVHHLFEWKFHWRVCSMRNIFHQCEFSRTIGKSFQLHR